MPYFSAQQVRFNALVHLFKMAKKPQGLSAVLPGSHPLVSFSKKRAVYERETSRP